MIDEDALVGMADRLPQLWTRVRHGEVVAWQARRIAAMTRHLSRAAARYVDRSVADYVTALPWGRLQTLVEARIIESDPAAAAARAVAANAERFVRTGRTTEQGLATIFARVEAGDAIWFCAMIDRLAAILGEDGDTDPIDVRRSKAVGIIADPPVATHVLATHGRSAVDKAGTSRPPGRAGTEATQPSTGPADGPTGHVPTIDAPTVAVPVTGAPGPSGDVAGSVMAARPWSTSSDESVPPIEQAWPNADPWERHRWIPEATWQAAHRRHHDDPGPTEPAAAAHPCPDTADCPADPADAPIPALRRGRAGDPDRAARSLAGLVLDPAAWRRLAPTAVVYVHLSADVLTGQVPGVARMEGAGPISVGQIRRFLGSGRVNVTVKPVIDLNDRPPAVDAWEIPAPIRERTRLRLPAEAFPWAAAAGTRPDLDHTAAYRPPERGGPSGQTMETRLGPLSRRHHNAKTRGRWQVRQPAAGVFVWRSPHRRTLIVDADGTHDYGRGSFADGLWHAARACPPVESVTADLHLRTGGVVDICYPRIRVPVDLSAEAA